MTKWIWIAVVIIPTAVAAGLVYANSNQPTQATGYVCPINGEELPCPKCCPAN